MMDGIQRYESPKKFYNHACPVCHSWTPEPKTINESGSVQGRPRRWCSPKCKQKHYRMMKAGTWERIEVSRWGL